MYKTLIKYENFEGNEVTKTLRFNLTETELADLDRRHDGNYQQEISSALKDDQFESKNIRLYDTIKEIILESYGVMTDNGDFIKTPENKNAFEHSQEYSTFFMSLIEDKTTNKFKEFFYGIFPKRLSDQIKNKAEELENNKNITQNDSAKILENRNFHNIKQNNS